MRLLVLCVTNVVIGFCDVAINVYHVLITVRFFFSRQWKRLFVLNLRKNIILPMTLCWEGGEYWFDV